MEAKTIPSLVEQYHLELKTNTSRADAAWQPYEQQTCHSVVNCVTHKVTLSKGWEGGGNELRV